MKINFIKLKSFIVILILAINLNSFIPNIEYLTTIKTNLSFPYYTIFSPIKDNLGIYKLWVSNNVYGSKLANCGYVAEFNYNSNNLNINFNDKFESPDVLGLAVSQIYNYVYPGTKCYPAISANNKFLLEANVDYQYLLYNYCFSQCCKSKELNYYVLAGKPGNLKFSPFKYKYNGIEYQLLIVTAAAYPLSVQSPGTSNFQMFTYALNYSVINQPLNPLSLSVTPTSGTPVSLNSLLDAPIDAQISPFADIDGNYLLSITNANSAYTLIFKLNISSPENITLSMLTEIYIGNLQQNYSAFSNSRYFAIDTIDTSDSNLHLYYFDEKFNIKKINSLFKTGILPQALTWSPDSKLLVVPNYISNNLTIFKATVPDISVKLEPIETVIYPTKSATLTATVTNGIPPYTFYFSNGTVITQNSPTASITVTPTNTTLYNVTVVDSEGNITGIANPVTVQVARAVIKSIEPDCSKEYLIIKGQVLDINLNMVPYTKIQLYLNNNTNEKIYVTSDKYGNFCYKYKIKN